MASVHKKNKSSWGVTYNYIDSNGKSRQKEETFRSEKEAEDRGKEVE